MKLKNIQKRKRLYPFFDPSEIQMLIESLAYTGIFLFCFILFLTFATRENNMLKIKKSISPENTSSQRFEYQAGVAFWIRPLTGTVLRDLRKQCTKTKMEFNPQTRKMEPVEEIDEAKLEDLLAEYILEKWEGVGGEDGQPLPATLESKKLILDQLALRNFIWAATQSLDFTGDEQKNS